MLGAEEVAVSKGAGVVEHKRGDAVSREARRQLLAGVVLLVLRVHVRRDAAVAVVAHK